MCEYRYLLWEKFTFSTIYRIKAIIGLSGNRLIEVLLYLLLIEAILGVSN
jgi:hypothetical protein